MYKKILVATDLVPHSSAKVVKAAVALAKTHNAKVHVLHVIEDYPLVYGGDTALAFTEEQESVIEDGAKKQLAKLCKRYDIPAKNQHVVRGIVKAEVVAFAKQCKANLLVLGTHSHHGLDLLLGSRADAIIHSAPMDVLAIRTHK